MVLQHIKGGLKRVLEFGKPQLSPEARIAQALQARFKEAELILVCFPKCGSTWIEVMLTQYLVARYHLATDVTRDLYRITKQLPSTAITWRTHDDDPHLKPAAKFETDKSGYAQKRVLLLVRDPRDVLVSYFFEYTKKKEYLAAGRPPFIGTIDDFVHHDIGELRAIIGFYNIWAGNTDVPREFSLITYEGLHRDAAGEVKRVLELIDDNGVDQACLEQAVAFGAFDNMRKLEERNSPGLRLNPNVQLGDTEGYKTRKGKVSGYKDYLSPATILEVDRIIRDELSDFYHFYKH